MASTATKSAPALGVTNWLEQVRALAPESRIPYVAIILAEAYERGLSPQQVAEALPKLSRDDSWNWPARWTSTLGSENFRFHANGSRLDKGPRHSRGPYLWCKKLPPYEGNTWAISLFVLFGFL